MTDEFVVGPGVAPRIEGLGLAPRGPGGGFAAGYGFLLTRGAPLWYSRSTSETAGPSEAAPERMPDR